MGAGMTKLHQQIDDMRARLAESSENERILLRALSHALDEVDQQLLQDVRQVTADHEARRVAILGELHILAARLCAFPAREAAATIDASARAVAEPARVVSRHAPGDWRLAARNIEDNLDLYAGPAAQPVRVE